MDTNVDISYKIKNFIWVNKILHMPDNQLKYHQKLANYFQMQFLYMDKFCEKVLNVRKIDELPWHLEKAGEWEVLYKNVSDIYFFRAFWEKAAYDVKRVWNCLQNATSHKIPDTYNNSTLNPKTQFDSALYAMQLLFDTGYPKESLGLALSIQEVLEEKVNNNLIVRLEAVNPGNVVVIDRMMLIFILTHKCRCSLQLGQINDSIDFANQAIKLGKMCEGAFQSRMNPFLFNTIQFTAEAAIQQGKLDEADKIAINLQELNSIGENAGLNVSVESVGLLNLQSQIRRKRGQFEEALRLLSKATRLCENVGIQDGLAVTLINEALTRFDKKEYSIAISILEKAEAINLTLGNKTDLSRCKKIHADILCIEGKLDQALKMADLAATLARETDFQLGLAQSISSQAIIYGKRHDSTRAITLFEDAEKINKNIGNLPGLLICMGNRANLLAYEVNDSEKALSILEEAFGIALKNDLTSIVRQFEPTMKQLKLIALVSKPLNEVNELRKKGNINGAIEVLLKAYDKVNKSNIEEHICPILHNLSLLLMEKEDWDNALRYLRELERQATSGVTLESLIMALANQAFIIFQYKKELYEAIPILQKAYKLSFTLQNPATSNQIGSMLSEIYNKLIFPEDGKIISPEKLAEDFIGRGDIMSAYAMYKTAEDLCRQLKDNETLQRVLSMSSILLHISGEFDNALKVIDEIQKLITVTKNNDSFLSTIREHLQIAEKRQEIDKIQILEEIYRQVQ
jgi:tetratricopeptide (TPR) repeat protein